MAIESVISHNRSEQLLATLQAVLRSAAALWNVALASTRSDETVDVLAEGERGSWLVQVPRNLTEEQCAAAEARSRVWEAVLYAATYLEDEALASAAAAYSVMQRTNTSRELPEFALPQHVLDVLAPYLLSSMVDESAHAQHLSEITQCVDVEDLRSSLQARYADALARTAAVVQLEKTLLALPENEEVDIRFILESKAFFQ